MCGEQNVRSLITCIPSWEDKCQVLENHSRRQNKYLDLGYSEQKLTPNHFSPLKDIRLGRCARLDLFWVSNPTMGSLITFKTLWDTGQECSRYCHDRIKSARPVLSSKKGLVRLLSHGKYWGQCTRK